MASNIKAKRTAEEALQSISNQDVQRATRRKTGLDPASTHPAPAVQAATISGGASGAACPSVSAAAPVSTAMQHPLPQQQGLGLGCALGVPCKSIPKPIPGPVLGIPSMPMPPKGMPVPFPMGMPPPPQMMMMMQMMMQQQQQMAMSAMMMGAGMPGCGMPMMPPTMNPFMMPGMPHAAGVPTAGMMPSAMGMPPFPGANPIAAPSMFGWGCDATSAQQSAMACMPGAMPPFGMLPQMPGLACPAVTSFSPDSIDLELEAKPSSSPSEARTDSSNNSSEEHLASDQDFASFISSFLVPGSGEAPAVPPTGDPVLDLHLDLTDLMEGGEALASGPLGLSLSHDTLLEALASTC